MAQLEDEPDEGLSTFSATQQEKKIADKLAENCNDIKVLIFARSIFSNGLNCSESTHLDSDI